jgi:hypothetical protein
MPNLLSVSGLEQRMLFTAPIVSPFRTLLAQKGSHTKCFCVKIIRIVSTAHT